jgi:site-specific recombinase XerD
MPFVLLDSDGCTVEPVEVFFRELLARGRSAATLYSYGNDLLRWFRFLSAIEVRWDRASRVEARDFCCWLAACGKPRRTHWRNAAQAGEPDAARMPAVPAQQSVAAVNAVTGKAPVGVKFAPATLAHSETVLRGFYDFHRDCGSGPIVNPFPLDRSRRERAHGHHNPMAPFARTRVALYRPKVPARIARSIPDEQFDELFARLSSHRDRALVAFYVSTGARASELLTVTQGGVDPGRGLITVVRKGSGALQQLPAAPDAFVWLRLYQVEMEGRIARGPARPVWWTLRAPHVPLAYHALLRMFTRAAAQVGANWTPHDLRHTAAYRMAEDPGLSLTDVQFVLGHALLSTTQRYLTPRQHEVVRRVLAHHADRERLAERRRTAGPAPGYDPAALRVLFPGAAP